ncbi:MAG: hypothetical protein L0Z53_08735 [Acidobacteriales bacterium]|nr:hypothetical protein [Terriglobales bacterium]
MRIKRDTVVLALLAALISIGAFFYFFRQDELLLYGDAVAHINIARRVLDSQQPGPLQLGTVWLPLPHLLMLPFVALDWAWRTGAAGAIVSMVAYVLGALGIFRLVRVRVGRKTAWLAAIAYLANPNLIYLQTTAMTEALYLALFIWTIVLVSEFFIYDRGLNEREACRCLRCALLTSVGMVLTRYDGWVAGLAAVVTVLAYLATRGPQAALSWQRVMRNFVLPLALVPVLWFAYNARFFGDALAFARGPYSARAISARSAAGGPAHPGDGNLAVAAAYFLKAAQLNMGEGGWGRAWLLAAVAGSLAALAFAPAFRVLLLLWLPLPFYALSIAYAGAPIFLPEWPPFSYYNSRYGLELLPAIAVFGAVLFTLTARRLRGSRLQVVPLIAAAVLLLGSYASAWRATPISLREARVNSVRRVAFQQKLAQALAELPPTSTMLMYTGDHVGALQHAGIHLNRTVNETLFRVWERALSDPASAADYVVALDGDAVWRAVQARSPGLTELARVSSPGQPTAVIYKANPSRQ